jgi:hypothetical protein
MTDKPSFSIGKAIRELLDHGNLTGVERATHYASQREFEGMPEHKWRSSANARDHALYVPVETFLARQLTTSTFPIGIETFGVSNLLTWSACLRAGATVLTGLSRNINLWEIGQLPTPQWLVEVGQVTPTDPLFAGYPISPKRISGMINVSSQCLRSRTEGQ